MGEELGSIAGLVVMGIGGNCPVQGNGSINGLPFYFRARGDSWSFSVAETPDGDPVDVNCGFAPGFCYEEEYGDGPFDAGWMTQEEAATFIQKAATMFLEAQANDGSHSPPADPREGASAPSHPNPNILNEGGEG